MAADDQGMWNAAAILIASSLIVPLSMIFPLASQAQGLVPLAPHHGQVIEGKILNLELVRDSRKIVLYPLSRMGKPVPLDELKITARVRSGKRATAIKLTRQGDGLTGELKSAKAKGQGILSIEIQARGEKEIVEFKIGS